MPTSPLGISHSLLQLLLLLFLGHVAIGQTVLAPLSPTNYRHLLQSARNGDVNARTNLGVRLQYGLSVPRDLVEAEHWLRAASGMGNPEAQFQLGVLYLQPEMVAEHGQDALRWFMRAASSGLWTAEYNIGLMYLRGLGTTMNLAEAERWLRKADRHGVNLAKSALGLLFLGSLDPRRKREGFEFLRKAAKEGDADGRDNLAYCYEFGIGTAPDLQAAVSLYRQAAKAGNPDAMHSLGLLYSSGKGVRRDPSEAFKWMKRACDAGDVPSCWGLGKMYLAGEGVAKNLVLAYTYIGIAHTNTEILDKLAPLLSEEDKSTASAEAEKWEGLHAMQLSSLPRYVDRTPTLSDNETAAGQ